MKISGRSVFSILALSCLYLTCIETANSHGVISVLGESCSSALERFRTASEKRTWVRESRKTVDASLDFREQAWRLKRLRRVNQALAQFRFSEEDLRELGWLRDGNPKPTRLVGGQRKGVAFTEVLLPLAQTGFYVPRLDLDRQLHQAIIIFIPGIGSKVSNALSVTDIAKTFSDRKMRAELGDQRDSGGNPIPGFRAFGVPLDMPLNGLGMNASGSLASAEGTLEVVRHAQLVLQILYPNMPIFLAGRSQGGLIAMAASVRWGPQDGLAGVISMNPSPTEIEDLRASVAIHEEDLSNIMGSNLEFHPPAWLAYRTATLDYNVSGPAFASALVLKGEGDGSYRDPGYTNWLESFVSQADAKRSLRVFHPGEVDQGVWIREFAHDMWRRGVNSGGREIANPVRAEVIGAMADFISAQLEEVPQREEILASSKGRWLSENRDWKRVEASGWGSIRLLTQIDLPVSFKARIWREIAQELRVLSGMPMEFEEIPAASGFWAFSLPFNQVLVFTEEGRVYTGKRWRVVMKQNEQGLLVPNIGFLSDVKCVIEFENRPIVHF